MKILGLIFILIHFGSPIYCGGIWEMELVNEQQIEMNGIHSINVSYRETAVTLLRSNTSSMIIKEYMNSNKEDYYAVLAKTENRVNITAGKRPTLAFTFKGHTEIYVPEAYTGSIFVKTKDGNIQVDEHLSFDTVTIESLDGNISVNGISVRSMNLRSSDGKIQCTVTEVLEDMAIASKDGSVTLNIPKDLFFKFSAKTSDRITAPFTELFSSPANDKNIYQGIIGTSGVNGKNPAEISIVTEDSPININWIN